MKRYLYGANDKHEIVAYDMIDNESYIINDLDLLNYLDISKSKNLEDHISVQSRVRNGEPLESISEKKLILKDVYDPDDYSRYEPIGTMLCEEVEVINKTAVTSPFISGVILDNVGYAKELDLRNAKEKVIYYSGDTILKIKNLIVDEGISLIFDKPRSTSKDFRAQVGIMFGISNEMLNKIHNIHIEYDVTMVIEELNKNQPLVVNKNATYTLNDIIVSADEFDLLNIEPLKYVVTSPISLDIKANRLQNVAKWVDNLICSDDESYVNSIQVYTSEFLEYIWNIIVSTDHTVPPSNFATYSDRRICYLYYVNVDLNKLSFGRGSFRLNYKGYNIVIIIKYENEFFSSEIDNRITIEVIRD